MPSLLWIVRPESYISKCLEEEWKEKLPNARANAYDLVLNGLEIGGGSLRIHNSGLQKEVFKTIGLSEK